MPRRVRKTPGGLCYHVINRGNGRATVFHKEDDYLAFLRLLSLACERHDMRLLAWCLMPNHFHMVVWPRADGDLSKFMQWLTTSHVRRYHKHYKGTGHVWQGRYKSFPCESSGYLLNVLRYVEQNPVRAKLVRKAEKWEHSSARFWRAKRGLAPTVRGANEAETHVVSAQVPDPFSAGKPENSRPEKGDRHPPPQSSGASQSPFPVEHWLEEGPVKRPRPWLEYVNRREQQEMLERLRQAVNRGSPFGADEWIENAAKKLGLESTLRPRGRPRKRKEK